MLDILPQNIKNKKHRREQKPGLRRETDRQTDRQTETETHRHRERDTQLSPPPPHFFLFFFLPSFPQRWTLSVNYAIWARERSDGRVRGAAALAVWASQSWHRHQSWWVVTGCLPPLAAGHAGCWLAGWLALLPALSLARPSPTFGRNPVFTRVFSVNSWVFVYCCCF